MARISSALIAGGLIEQSASNEPLHRQLYRRMRDQILTGKLKHGDRLPSTRTLANDLGLSRNTVSHAFEQLTAEGYLEAETGSGTFVARELPPAIEHVAIRTGPESDDKVCKWSQYALRLEQSSIRKLSAPAWRPFQPGFPALDEFPHDVWGRLLNQLRTNTPLYGYGTSQGYEPLRKAIASYLNMARGVVCSPEQVVIVSGAQQALQLIVQLLVDPGDSVLLEDPSYAGARAVLQSWGTRINAVGVQRDGISSWELPRRRTGAKLAYLTPSNHFPLGASMPVSRRLEWIQWARDASAFLIEDDYDSEFRYHHRPLPAMQSLDKHGRVIYVGTFSKVMFPALRVGYIVAPPGLVETFVLAKAAADFHGPVLEQAALFRFMDEGHFGRHIRRMRALYEERLACVLEILERDFRTRFDVIRPEGGMHVAAVFKNRVNDAEVSAAAMEAGISAMPLSTAYVGPGALSGLLLGFAGYRPRQMQGAGKKLLSVVNAQFAR